MLLLFFQVLFSTTISLKLIYVEIYKERNTIKNKLDDDERNGVMYNTIFETLKQVAFFFIKLKISSIIQLIN